MMEREVIFPEDSSYRPNTERRDTVRSRKTFTSRSYRPFSTVRNSIDVGELEARHKSHIDATLNIFAKTEKRQEKAYIRTHVRPRVIPGLGKRMKDKGVIETIMTNRIEQWRQELQDGKDAGDINVSVVKRMPLPHENPKKQRKNHRQPVFYWG